MSYLSLLSFATALASCIIGTILLRLLTQIFRRRRIKRIAKIRIDILAINVLVALALLTNPLQNAIFLRIFIAIIYIAQYYIIGKVSLGNIVLTKEQRTNRKAKSKRSFSKGVIFTGTFLIVTIIIGSGDFIKIMDITTQTDYNNIAIADNNNDGKYDTIAYDQNGDGKVDTISQDTNHDGQINETKDLHYNAQKILLLICLLVFLIMIFNVNRRTKHKTHTKKHKKKKSVPAPSFTAGTAILFILTLLSLQLANPVLAQVPNMQMIETQYKTCAEDPFEDSKCSNVPADIRIYMQHTRNPDFQQEMQVRGAKLTSTQDPEILAKYATEYQTRRNTRKTRTPMEFVSMEELLETAGQNQNNEDHHDNGRDDGLPRPDDNETETNTETDDKPSEDEYADGSITFDTEEEDGKRNETTPNTDIPVIIEPINIPEPQEPVETIELEDIAQEILEDINNLVGNSNDLTPGIIGEQLETRLENNEIDSGKFGKVFDGAGAAFDIYDDAKEFSEKFNGDETKIAVATATTTFGKRIIGSNPVDVTVGFIEGGLNIIGQENAAEEIGKFKAEEIVKQTVIDAYDTNAEEFQGVIHDQVQEIINTRDDKQYNIVEKVGITMNAVSTMTYGSVVRGVSHVIEAAEEGIKALSDGVKEISSWFSW